MVSRAKPLGRTNEGGLPDGASGHNDRKRLQVRLLGNFELLVAGEPKVIPQPGQRLIAMLALDHGGWLGRTQIAGTLWPDSTETAARSNLRSALSSLGSLRSIVVETTPDNLRLEPHVTVDLQNCRRIARRMLDGPDHVTGGLLSAFAADLLPHWDDGWLEPERESYRQLRLHLLEKMSERLTREGRFGRAVEAGLLAVAAAPLRESAHRAVIRALAAEGNRGEALDRYNALAAMLNRELGVEPSFRFEDVLVEANRHS